MGRLKPIIPSLKEKKRYLVYEVITDKQIKIDLSSEIVKKVTTFLGLFDSAKAGIQSVNYNKQTQRGVLRVGNKGVDKLKTSLALINQLNDEELTIRTIGISGILKKAKDRYQAS